MSKSKANTRRSKHRDTFKVLLIGIRGTFTSEDLEKFFLKSYKIKSSIKIQFKNKNKSKVKGTGTMTIKGAKTRDNILKNSPYELSGRLFHAKPFLKGKQLKQFQKNVKKRRVFVNCIPIDFNNELLKEAFSVFGEVEDGFAIKEVNSDSKNLGYGFVMFKEIKSAEDAIETGYLKVKNVKL